MIPAVVTVKMRTFSVFLLLIAFSLSLAPALAFAAPTADKAAPSPVGLRLDQSGQEYLDVEWIMPAFEGERLERADQDCQIIRAEGLVQNSSPGHPQLPVKGFLLGVPPVASLKVEVLEVEMALAPGRYNICPGGQPIIEYDQEGGPYFAGERYQRDPQAYQADKFTPQALYEIQPAGQIRSQHVARLLIQPFQYNPHRGELRYAARLRLRVSFNQSSTPPQTDAVPNEGYFEGILQSALLNYEQARSWRQTISVTPTPYQPAAPPGNYKITVDQDGLFQLTYADLQAAGVPVDSLAPQTLKLTNQGQEVHIYVSGEGDGIFNPGDYLLFYGQKALTRYTETNVYWLSWDGVNGLRMAAIDGAPGAPAAIPAHFFTKIHLEEDKIYQASRPSGPGNDRWYWARIQNPETSYATWWFETTISLHNLSAQPVNARLTGLLRGYYGSPQQWSKMYINGNLVDDKTWASGGEYSFDFTFPQAYLVEGDNTIRIEGPTGGGITQQAFFVNWLALEYYDTYVAENDFLPFEGDTGGDWEYYLTSFTGNTVDLFDITIPAQPQRVVNALVNDSGGGLYEAVFTHQIAGEHRYLALSPARRLQPLAIEPVSSANLRSSQNGADYIVITHSDFISQAQRLADHRAAMGYRVKVVDVEDVYNEFSFGLFDPNAIHDFLAFTFTDWQAPAPSFILLFGDGNFDYKGGGGSGELQYIPPYLGDVDPYLGETASDNRFVTVSGGDFLPDMHIGRLTAKTLAEATGMVDKILGYETTRPTDDWNLKAIFVADDNDPDAGNFPVISDSVIASSLPLSYTPERIYYKVTHASVDDVTQAIISSVDQGALLVSYIGHASVQWWAFEQLFTKDDVAGFGNPDRLSFFLSMTCQDGYFINPSGATDASALAEVLLRSAGKGAVASWSPSGLGVASGHDLLEKSLLDVMLNQGLVEIGAAATHAKLELYGTSSAYWDLIDTYILFGDPAMPLNTQEHVGGGNIYLPLVAKN